MIVLKKSAKVIIIGLIMAFILIPNVNLCADVNDISDHWAKDSISRLLDKGITTGYPDNSFRPETVITRAEFVTSVNRVFSFTSTQTDTYVDVSDGDWFFSEVSRAKAAGYILGYGDGTFRPNQHISRQEAAVILARILNISPVTSSFAFSDQSSISEWSLEGVQAMTQAGYLSGYPDGSFAPEKPISRAEAATILDRLCTKLKLPSIPVQPQIPPGSSDASYKFSTIGTRPLIIPMGIVSSVTIQIEDIEGVASKFGINGSALLNGSQQLILRDGDETIPFEVVEIAEIQVTVLQASWISENIKSEAEVLEMPVTVGAGH